MDSKEAKAAKMEKAAGSSFRKTKREFKNEAKAAGSSFRKTKREFKNEAKAAGSS